MDLREVSTDGSDHDLLQDDCEDIDSLDFWNARLVFLSCRDFSTTSQLEDTDGDYKQVRRAGTLTGLVLMAVRL